MPCITVNTTSSSFGLLLADLAQYANWINQYAPGLTIYQPQRGHNRFGRKAVMPSSATLMGSTAGGSLVLLRKRKYQNS